MCGASVLAPCWWWPLLAMVSHLNGHLNRLWYSSAANPQGQVSSPLWQTSGLWKQNPRLWPGTCPCPFDWAWRTEEQKSVCVCVLACMCVCDIHQNGSRDLSGRLRDSSKVAFLNISCYLVDYPVLVDWCYGFLPGVSASYRGDWDRDHHECAMWLLSHGTIFSAHPLGPLWVSYCTGNPLTPCSHRFQDQGYLVSPAWG